MKDSKAKKPTARLKEMKKKEPQIIKEFKEFINRGSVVDLAVGIIIGGAFTSIVNSLVNDIVMPLLSMIIGGIDFTDLKITIPAYLPGIQPATINYGNFIQAAINFLVISFVIFLMIRFLNNMKKKAAPEEPAQVEDKAVTKAEDDQTEILKEIRDLMKSEKKSAKK